MNPITIVRGIYKVYLMAKAAAPVIKVASYAGASGVGIGTGVILHKAIEKRFSVATTKENPRDKVLKERGNK